MPIKRTEGSKRIRWNRTLAHEECAQCKRAAEHAKTDAIVAGLDWATYTVRPDHVAAVESRR